MTRPEILCGSQMELRCLRVVMDRSFLIEFNTNFFPIYEKKNQISTITGQERKFGKYVTYFCSLCDDCRASSNALIQVRLDFINNYVGYYFANLYAFNMFRLSAMWMIWIESDLPMKISSSLECEVVKYTSTE